MEQQRLRLEESRITLLDPKNTLKRGYSITWFNGKPLRDASEVSAGDIITTELYQGKTSSTVNSKEK
jgi:exodeoxyribonuclease VII large subunit